jgi:hypothetical protein
MSVRSTVFAIPYVHVYLHVATGRYHLELGKWLTIPLWHGAPTLEQLLREWEQRRAMMREFEQALRERERRQ